MYTCGSDSATNVLSSDPASRPPPSLSSIREHENNFHTTCFDGNVDFSGRTTQQAVDFKVLRSNAICTLNIRLTAFRSSPTPFFIVGHYLAETKMESALSTFVQSCIKDAASADDVPVIRRKCWRALNRIIAAWEAQLSAGSYGRFSNALELLARRTLACSHASSARSLESGLLACILESLEPGQAVSVSAGSVRDALAAVRYAANATAERMDDDAAAQSNPVPAPAAMSCTAARGNHRHGTQIPWNDEEEDFALSTIVAHGGKFKWRDLAAAINDEFVNRPFVTPTGTVHARGHRTANGVMQRPVFRDKDHWIARLDAQTARKIPPERRVDWNQEYQAFLGRKNGGIPVAALACNETNSDWDSTDDLDALQARMDRGEHLWPGDGVD